MYRRILVIVSERPEAQAALAEGLELASVHRAEVLFLSVVPPFNTVIADMVPLVPSASDEEELERGLREQAERLQAEARDEAARQGVRSAALVVVGSDPATSIASVARQRGCDLIVAGADQHNALMRILTGSVIPGLITQAPVPVLVCHQRSAPVAAAVASGETGAN